MTCARGGVPVLRPAAKRWARADARPETASSARPGDAGAAKLQLVGLRGRRVHLVARSIRQRVIRAPNTRRLRPRAAIGRIEAKLVAQSPSGLARTRLGSSDCDSFIDRSAGPEGGATSRVYQSLVTKFGLKNIPRRFTGH